MSTKQRQSLRKLSLLAKRDYRECASPTCLPVDREIFRIDLQVLDLTFTNDSSVRRLTLTKFVSQALFDILRLS